MFIILFIFIIGIPLIKEWVENENYRKQCHDRGMDTYWANDGTYRYTAYCEANRPGLRSKTAAFCF